MIDEWYAILLWHLIAGRYYGDRAIYTCDSGHQIVGNEERVCQETGLWSGSEPYCKKRGEGDQADKLVSAFILGLGFWDAVVFIAHIT